MGPRRPKTTFFSRYMSWLAVAALLQVCAATHAKAPISKLSMKARITCHAAIEKVRWNNRIWPESNPGPKPAFEDMVSDAWLREQAQDSVRMTRAGKSQYSISVTPQLLQDELNRMVRNSRDPHTLGELFAAVGNDPYKIVECLVRPELSKSLLQNAFAMDANIHGSQKHQLQLLLDTQSPAEVANTHSGNTRKYTAVHASVADQEIDAKNLVSDTEWEQLIARWERQNKQISTTESSRVLQESSTSFYRETITRIDEKRFSVTTVYWPKLSFYSWWEANKIAFSTQLESSDTFTFTLPSLDTNKGRPTNQSPREKWIRPYTGAHDRAYHHAVWTGSEMLVYGGKENGLWQNDGGIYMPSTDSWRPISTTGAPAPRENSTAVWTGSELVIWGGQYDSEPVGTGARYNYFTNSWRSLPTLGSPSPRYDHTAVWTGDYMIIWGGHDGETPLGNGYMFSPVHNSWFAVSPVNAPDARSQHTAVWTGSEMIVWGGYSDNYTNSGGRFNPNTQTWVETSRDNVAQWRVNHTAIWTGREMLVWGGRSFNNILNNGGVYTPASDRWVTINTNGAPSKRQYHTANWDGLRMIIWGGKTHSNSLLKTGARFDPRTNSWESMPTLKPDINYLGYFQHSAVWTGSELIILGEQLLGRYRPSLGIWTHPRMDVMPESNYNATTVWTGQEVLHWGGSNNIANAYVYEPATDRWSMRSDNNAPASRKHPSSVWTGIEMIVWGGDSPVGGRYRPLTDSWTQTSAVGTPATRNSPPMVWTGTEMMLWGNGVGGGRYKPSSNSWQSLPNPGVYDELVGNHFVWTGSDVMLWGGYVPGTNEYPSTLWRFDPSQDTWTSFDSAFAPGGRHNHGTVWTGSELLVWGGCDEDDPYLNTGGIFDPERGQWRPMSRVGAPTPRINQSAVWSGIEMIVWGGRDDFSNTQTGGRFDPNTNSWVETTTTNATSMRRFHHAHWTGDTMIVLGGSYSGTDFYGTYKPAELIYQGSFENATF